MSKRLGTHLMEDWEEGTELQLRLKEKQDLIDLREEMKEHQKRLKKQLPPPDAVLEQMTPEERTSFLDPKVWRIQDESLAVRIDSIKRDEKRIDNELARLRAERERLLGDIQRSRNQSASKFGGFASLCDGRYLVLNLLGKGGFSEVHKAYDLHEHTLVALKIHQLGSEWSESHKQSYIKHAVREANIHKSLQHRSVVRMLDVFEISESAFATVMELCEGGDLDQHLRRHIRLPEQEARAITVQMLECLLYLNTPRAGQSSSTRVIHYDLKPPNILFDRFGQVKVADFGLSKEVGHGETMGQELTSRGAGTYWYLPPEVFEGSLISSKVDVWSVGCMLYQMVYGGRPFGAGMSQEDFLRKRAFEKARNLEFPTDRRVSDECKSFIKRCLAYRPQDRPDVFQALEEPYMANFRQKK